MKFVFWVTVALHLFKAAISAMATSYMCPVCMKRFATEKRLLVHQVLVGHFGDQPR